MSWWSLTSQTHHRPTNTTTGSNSPGRVTPHCSRPFTHFLTGEKVFHGLNTTSECTQKSEKRSRTRSPVVRVLDDTSLTVRMDDDDP